MTKHAKLAIVAAVVGAVVVVYVTRRSPNAATPPSASTADERSSAAGLSHESQPQPPNGSAGLTQEEMLAGISSDERKTTTLMNDEVRPLYLTGWYSLRHPTSDATALEPVMAAVERSLVTNPKNSPKLFENPLAPAHGGFGLAILSHMWYISGPITGLEDRIETQAIRLADCPDDDVVRAAAVVMLQVMQERSTGRGLSKEAKTTLKRLLANDFIRHMAEKQRRDLDDDKQKADHH